ncbi:MAG: flagellar M-ring protein FliF [Candidatus Cellulosilyticum pullistercoris]|uniref:Flagellar M-ring protein FliF n=1 Tax=Candidatus Cellulosilyticum pullistercoris TaxID=2838521 RepID=A0A9E2KAW1_9FIRM|nr:flagellar M-ring protein FliF [Candidatus Cellulosilyticum pullistercoris]
MQETIQQMSNQVTEKWNNLTKKQKIQIGIGIVAVIITIIIISILMQPKYKVLFSENIESKTIADVANVLTENNIKYHVINNSTNIEVVEDQYQEALMYTASSGVTENGMTLEQLLNNDMSTTQNELNLKNKEYLKNSLQNTLVKIEGVQEARVELVVPEEKNAYLQSQAESSASIFLTLSKPLTSSQCEGIANYVALSVQNLNTKNIVIIDSTGVTLYSGPEEVGTSLGKQQELKASAENELKQKVINLIGNMYDDVRISPNLILNFDEYQETNENYSSQGDDPSRGVIIQENEVKSSSKNGSTGDIPGTDTNGGDTITYQNEGEATSESRDSQKEITYAPNKQSTIYKKNSGDVDLDKSSLAVNLINNRLYKEEEVQLLGKTWSEFKEENKGQKILDVDETVINSIRNATGIKNVVVNAYENPIFLDQEAYVIDYKDWIPYILVVAVLILIAFVILKFRKQEDVVEVEPELEVEEMLKAVKEQVELEEIEIKENLETKRQIDKFVDEKPEAVANLLRNWLTDEDWE